MKQFCGEAVRSLVPRLPELIDLQYVVGFIQTAADEVMVEKLRGIGKKEVKGIAEGVLWRYLEVVIVWGNVFGALIGLLTYAIGFSRLR